MVSKSIKIYARIKKEVANGYQVNIKMYFTDKIMSVLSITM